MTLAGASAVPTRDGGIDDVIDQRAITSVFMPVVRLDTFTIMGYEALARGPQGTKLESPGALFAQATAVGREAELDWVCRAAAYKAALEAKLPPSQSVFVNTDPTRLAATCPSDLATGVWRAESKLRVIIEVSERTLAASPAAVASAMQRARRVGWGLALDDVGTAPEALALLSVVEPDVIKVDLAALARREERHVALVVNTVLAEAERTDAVILAEGIEGKRHLALARAIGAELGQGFLFGKPGPLPLRTEPVPRPVQFMPPSTTGTAPFAVLAAASGTRSTSEQTLESLRRNIEVGAATCGGPVLQATSWPDHRTLIVIGTHFAAALVAKDRDANLGDSDRRFEFCLSYDRETVLAATRALLGWSDGVESRVAVELSWQGATLSSNAGAALRALKRTASAGS